MTTYDVRELDLTDSDLLRTAHALAREAALVGRPDAPFWSEQEYLVEFQQQDESETVTLYGAFDGDALIGCGFLALPQLDNREKCFMEVWTRPALRRRGVGSALVSAIADVAQTAGRTLMLAWCGYPFDQREDHPYRRFAEKNGFVLSLDQIRRDLALPVPQGRIDGWAAEAAEHHDGYEVQTFEGLIPDDLLESFLYVVNQLIVDAPQGDVDFEPEAVTPEVYKQRQLRNIEAGRTVLNTVAIDGTGAVVAYTNLSVPLDPPDIVYQWGTLVHREHRGHRLGLAVKARNLAELQRRFPGRSRMTTINAEVNAQMVGINEQMGFVAKEIDAEFKRVLA